MGIKRRKKLKSQMTLLAWLCGCSLLLAACSGGAETEAKTGSNQDTKTESTASSKADAGDTDENKVDAYNAYVGAHNQIIGMFYGRYKGVENLLDAYKEQKLGSDKPVVNKNVGPTLYLNTSSINNLVQSLEKGQAYKIGGSYAELEGSAAKLLATAKQLTEQGNSLETYFKAKKYLDDNYAQAKAENDKFVAQWEQFNSEFDAFSAQLGKVEKTERAEQIQAFEKEGKLREAAQSKSLLAANEILSILDKPEDLKDAAKMQQADAEIQKLEAALEELKAAMAKTEDSDSYKFKRTFDYLTTFTGSWRELKASKDPSKYENLVSNYNSALR